jgi:mRNA-degrading endonuclease RelE of RelBE toxin-antitoxin system
MKYEVIPVPNFKKEAKKLLKRYKSLDGELRNLFTSLCENPNQGTFLGNNFYKIRIAIKSKVSGKSGGARSITYVVGKNNRVYLLNIYDKGDFASVDLKTLQKIIVDIE